ncbi:hypothetical protein AAF712_004856 [Marasmius tenuissimus]|uniref:F-box domain-containing protein n=1 Tax=Marasmius tenuissimus TaxID=585030 RepID=A0ABR3A2J0_9AGAR
MSYLPRSFPSEVTKLIFDTLFLTERNRALRYGLVCTNWFKIWVACRWHTLDDLSRVLIILVNGRVIDNPPTAETWSRFETVYASSVKSVVIGPTRLFNSMASFKLHLHLRERYGSMTAGQCSKPVFPNLKAITLDGLTFAASPFTAFHHSSLADLCAHTGVKHFVIQDSVERMQDRYRLDLIFLSHGHSVQYQHQPASRSVHVYVSDIFFQEDDTVYPKIATKIVTAACRTAASRIDLPTIPSLLDSVDPIIESLYTEGVQGLPVNVTFSIQLPTRETCVRPILADDYSSFRNLELVSPLCDVWALFVNMKVQNPLTVLKLDLADINLRKYHYRGRALFLTLSTIAKSCGALVECRITVRSASGVPTRSEFPGETVLIPRNEFVPGASAITSRMLSFFAEENCGRLEVLEIRDLYPMPVDMTELESLLRKYCKLRVFRLGYSSLDAVKMWHDTNQNWRDGLKSIDPTVTPATTSALEVLEVPVVQVKNLQGNEQGGVSGGFERKILPVGHGVYRLVVTKF